MPQEIKVLRVKCPFVTGITKTTVITDVCWSDIETITDLDDQYIQNILNKLQIEEQKFKKGAL